MEHPQEDEILARWLAGKLSKEEEQALLSAYELNDLKAVLDDVDTWKMPERNTEAQYRELRNRMNTKKQPRIISMKTWMAVAASILVIVGGYWIYQIAFSSSMIYIQTGMHEQMSYVFPDGSVAELDATTTISFDEETWKNKRLVNLNGQALFDVVSGTDFMVSTTAGRVEVLGTVFNVRNADDMLKADCYEGSVRVSQGELQTILKPQETVTIYQGTLQRGTLTDTVPDWKQGVTKFENTRLSHVVAVLNKRYNTTIDLPKRYNDIKFTGQFVHNDLQQAVKMVFAPSGISYTFDNGQVKF